MKKKLTAIFLCVALVAIAVVGASLAYFTDTDSATNTFTVGNVKIDLIESRYHREGNDNSGDTTIPDPTHKVTADDGMKYVTTGHTMFTDEEIKEDAKTYQNDYLAVKGANMVPGRGVAKCPYVVNTGANDAYIRIRVMVPSAANNDFVAVKDGGVITNQWCSSCIGQGEFIDGKGGGWNRAGARHGSFTPPRFSRSCVQEYHCKLTGSWRSSLPKLHLTWVGIALHLPLAVLICGECSAQVVLAHPV